MSFGENVGFYRRQLNITQEELAERLFVSRQTVSRWETDSTFPDVEMIISLCELFECDMDTLVRGSAQDGAKNIAVKSAEEDTDTIEKMQRELKMKRLLNERIIGVIAGTTALLSALAYFLFGFLGDLWHPMWLIFVGATIVIAVSAVVTDAVIGITDLQKKIRYEKKMLKKQAQSEEE